MKRKGAARPLPSDSVCWPRRPGTMYDFGDASFCLRIHRLAGCSQSWAVQRGVAGTEETVPETAVASGVSIGVIGLRSHSVRVAAASLRARLCFGVLDPTVRVIGDHPVFGLLFLENWTGQVSRPLSHLCRGFVVERGGGIAGGAAHLSICSEHRGDAGQLAEPVVVPLLPFGDVRRGGFALDRKSTRLNSSHLGISYA